ncbi:MAG: EAL domain-containing protein [Gammaproteobacteria bacterium]|nr:EAL domain-containing protein [Gammaproteobacteria bacterium]
MEFRDLDLDRYASLMRRLLPQASAFIVCDTAGLRRWNSECASSEDSARVVAQLNENTAGWAENETLVCHSLINDQVAVTRRIDINDSAAGTIIAVMPCDEFNEAEAAEGLAIVVDSLVAEGGFLMELDAMAAELSERYEELNLIYVTEDNVKYFDEGQDALRKLVQNTGRFLDTGLVALVMSDRNVTTSQGNNAMPMTNVDQILQMATTGLYERIEQIKDSVVLNDAGSDADSPGMPDLKCKLMADPIFDENGTVIGMLLIANEIHAKDFRASDAKLLRVMSRKAARIIQVNYDSLTGMMTRHGFEYHLETALYVVRYKRIGHCVLHLNLDRVHVVNDSCSHHAGDDLLRRVAQQIRKELKDGDIVARLGGDQFGVLMADCSRERGREIAERIRESVSKAGFIWDKRRFDVSVSIGVAAMAPESESIVSVLGAAEVACNVAKKNGRNRVEVYERDSKMLMRRREAAEWIGHLHNALREDRFVLYCQSIEPLQEGVGVPHSEILLRLRNEHDQVLDPGQFLPAAERYNLMPAIDRWVVRNTLKTLAANLPRRVRAENVWAINLSGQSVGDSAFMDFVRREVAQADVSPENICFEITETAAVADLDNARHFVQAMKEHGFKFALDDFGTGLSSFAYLKTLPVDYLKIDGAFVKEIVEDRVSESMVAAITQIGHVMGLETIAEFVENDKIKECLVGLGVTFGQGYGIDRPRPLMELMCELTPQLMVSGL